jgi:hypothetical protein
MPNPNLSYEDYLAMFGTQEQKDAWKKKREFWDKWIAENIPVYEPSVRGVHNRLPDTENNS